ncbi:MAG: GGDEF domain-containing protein, partial [Methylotenera sp.]
MLNINKQNKSTPIPIEIAREAIKQMAVRKVDPTPENYHLIYNEVASIPMPESLESAIKEALKQLPNKTTEQHDWIGRWEKLLSKRKWTELPALMSEGMDTSITFSTQWPEAIRKLLKGLDTRHVGLEISKKKEALGRVLINFGNDPLLAQKIKAMTESWDQY